jgi:hypothetical protein
LCALGQLRNWALALRGDLSRRFDFVALDVDALYRELPADDDYLGPSVRSSQI